MDHQDWGATVIHSKKSKVVSKTIEDKKGDTSKKDIDRKLENDNAENFKHVIMPKALANEITKARMSMKKTRDEFSRMLEIKSTIYTDIENGKAIYNSETKKIVNKIENKFKVKFVNK
jgi:ribosome-binding protein aMBF1 (putative translation factor)